jgi:hypothetical protein
MDIALLIIGVVVLLLLLLLLGGFVASRQRTTDWSLHVAEADHALEAARAEDKGWDRGLLDRSAREALESKRPGWAYRDLHLVLVDDKPGVEEDKAHFVAAGGDGEARVVLARQADGGWRVESVG